MQVELPAEAEFPVEIQLLIVDQIADFKLWYSVRFVCQAWLARILAEQDRKVWKFVKFHNNAFLLPNGVKHGLEIISGQVFMGIPITEKFYGYKYGKLIKDTSCLGHNTSRSIYSDIPFLDTLISSYRIYMLLDNYYVMFQFIKNECKVGYIRF